MYIAIDMGGTNTRIAFSEKLSGIEKIEKYPTPKNLSDIKKELKKHIEKNTDSKKIKAIVLGTAGQINRGEKTVVFSPHIKTLAKTSIQDLLPYKTDILILENDAALAGLAEANMDYAKNYSRVAYITISTGVGGTIIIDKHIPETKYNFEPGHHILDSKGKTLALSNIKGSWESLSSGTAFKKTHKVNPKDCTNKTIWKKYGADLAKGLHNITLMWQPELIIIGGSLTKKYDLFRDSMEQNLNATLDGLTPTIKISRLDDTNGLVGGLTLLRQKVGDF